MTWKTKQDCQGWKGPYGRSRQMPHVMEEELGPLHSSTVRLWERSSCLQILGECSAPSASSFRGKSVGYIKRCSDFSQLVAPGWREGTNSKIKVILLFMSYFFYHCSHLLKAYQVVGLYQGVYIYYLKTTLWGSYYHSCFMSHRHAVAKLGSKSSCYQDATLQWGCNGHRWA